MVSTLAVLALASFPRSASTAQLRFEPGTAYLGSFSTLDHLDSDVVPGGVSVGVISDGDWRLEVGMRSPLRRTADGLTLPTDRATGRPGTAESPIFSLEPRIVMSGSATGEEALRDWRELARALEAYLDRADPPGRYEGTLFGRLLDSSGTPVTDYVSLSIQFDIAPWVQIVDRRVPDFTVPVLDGAHQGTSATESVRLVSNSS